MPHEIRRLYFSEPEVTKAILGLNTQAKQKFLIPGSLSGIALSAEPSLHLDIRVESVDGEMKTISLNETLVGAAIIRFCIEEGVPLPLHANKSLSIHNGQLVLDITWPRSREDASAGTRAAVGF